VVNIKPGRLVYWKNQTSVVLEIKGVSHLVVRDTATRVVRVVSNNEVATIPGPVQGHIYKDLMVEERDWYRAVERYNIIRPLIGLPGRSSDDIQKAADNAGRCASTVHRWVAEFEESGLMSSLLRAPRMNIGQWEASYEVEEIIQANLSNYYSEGSKPTITELHRRIELDCRDSDLPIPHFNVVAVRVRRVDERNQVDNRFNPGLGQSRKQLSQHINFTSGHLGIDQHFKTSLQSDDASLLEDELQNISDIDPNSIEAYADIEIG